MCSDKHALYEWIFILISIYINTEMSLHTEALQDGAYHQ